MSLHPVLSLGAIGWVALALLSTPAAADDPNFTLSGDCGGSFTGYDHNTYACDRDRRPACEQSTGQRCRCLERRECGGKRDEPF